jgi:hypothetical protein
VPARSGCASMTAELDTIAYPALQSPSWRNELLSMNHVGRCPSWGGQGKEGTPAVPQSRSGPKMWREPGREGEWLGCGGGEGTGQRSR